MLGSWSIVSACPEEDCKGVRGDETKLAAAGERRQTAPALQSRRPEGAPPEVTRLAFSSLKCSTGKGSILTFSLKINCFVSMCYIMYSVTLQNSPNLLDFIHFYLLHGHFLLLGLAKICITPVSCCSDQEFI